MLVGDYLFARSFQLMTETGSIRVLDILANASAVIAEGEVLQLTAASDLATDEATYLQVVRGKTAALFAAATEVGGGDRRRRRGRGARRSSPTATRSGSPSRSPTTCSTTAGAAATLGKNVGDDFRERKMTLPVIRALAAGDAEERAFWARTIGKGRQEAGDLDRALAILHARGALASTHDAAVAYADRARAALAALPAGPLRDDLADLAEFVVERTV